MYHIVGELHLIYPGIKRYHESGLPSWIYATAPVVGSRIVTGDHPRLEDLQEASMGPTKAVVKEHAIYEAKTGTLLKDGFANHDEVTHYVNHHYIVLIADQRVD